MASLSLRSLVFIEISNNQGNTDKKFYANIHKVCHLYTVEAKAKVWQLVREQEMMVYLHCKYKYISCLT